MSDLRDLLTRSKEEAEIDRLRDVIRKMVPALHWVPTDDKEITCGICGKPGSTLEARIRAASGIPLHWVGLHETCLAGLVEKLDKPPWA